MEVIRAMTWNTWWRFGGNWLERESGILEVVRSERPHLLGIQECWGTADDSQAHLIARDLGHHAAFVEVGLPPATEDGPDQAGVVMGLGLVSAWPIAEVAAEPMPSEGRLLQALVATVAHPRGPMRVVVGATSWEPERLAETEAQVAALGSLVRATELPALLLADLNYDTELAAIRETGLRDAWDAAAAGADPRTLSSTNRFAPSEAVNQFERRIDHILYDPGPGAAVAVDARILRHEPGGLPPSDHYPVVADFGLEAET